MQVEDLATETGQERGGRVQADDLTAVDDRDAVAEAFRLVQVVGGQEDRHLLAGAEVGDVVE